MKSCVCDKLHKRCGKLAALLAFCMVLLPVASLWGAGLTLYSYKDSAGTIIVVDSIEKVPLQYRDQVEKGFIPSFSSKKKLSVESTAESGAGENVAAPVEMVEPIDLDAPGRIEVTAAPDEIELPDPAVASVTLIMNDIREIQLNYERLHVQALARGLGHPIIRHLHLSNVRMLQNVIAPSLITLENGAAWRKSAGEVIEQMRSLQYTVSRWIDGSSRGIVEAMPPLLARMKMQISRLENEYSIILKTEATRLNK